MADAFDPATPPQPPATLLITALTLTDFRSYASATLAIAAGTVVLHGPNGAGKTNLLEALSLFTPGKGLRGASAPEMGRREPGETTGPRNAQVNESQPNGPSRPDVILPMSQRS